MKSVLIAVVVAVGVMLILVACDFLESRGTFNPDAPREPVPCEQIVEDRLLALPMGRITLTETVQWAQQTYQVEPRVEPSTIGIVYVRWEQEPRSYTGDAATAFVRGISARWLSNPPLAREILDCIGEPAYYQAYHDPTPDGPTYTVLNLWYPDRGLSFYGAVPAPLTVIDGRLPMPVVSYTEPGTLDEVLSREYVAEPGSEDAQLVRESIQLWPGSLEKIEVDKHPWWTGRTRQ